MVGIKKIMMVDDDPYIRRLGEISLSKVGGWEVALARSGAEAVEKAAKEKPDVILLDVMMPNMDGPSTLQRLRQVEGLQNTPVIFITAKVQTHEIERYLLMDAQGVVSKPFDPMMLPNEIRRIVCGTTDPGNVSTLA